MRVPRAMPGFLAGFLVFDLLVNLPGFLPAFPVGSLILPSIDLLVVAAALLGVAQAGGSARVPLRIVTCGLLVILLAFETASRFGSDIALRLLGGGSAAWIAGSCAVSLALVAAAAGVAWLASGLLLQGFSSTIVRSTFLVVVALCAILQVATRYRIFAPSAIPRLFRDLWNVIR